MHGTLAADNWGGSTRGGPASGECALVTEESDMSWDVLIMRTDPRMPLHELPNDFVPESLGDADELRRRLAEFFGLLDWSDLAWGIFVGDGYALEFNFTRSGPVDAFTLHVHGGGDPVSPIVAMCKRFGWQACDCSTGEFMDLEHPSTDSWERFQAFRDKIVAQHRGQQDSQS